MAKEKEGDSIEGRERDEPLGCVATKRWEKEWNLWNAL
jgi:hypothetical protein